MADNQNSSAFVRLWKHRWWKSAYLSDGNENSDMPTSQQMEKKKTVFDPLVLKAFLAGVVLSHLSKNLVLGLAVGALSGVYIQQNYSGVPHVASTWKEFLKKLEESGPKRK